MRARVVSHSRAAAARARPAPSCAPPPRADAFSPLRRLSCPAMRRRPSFVCSQPPPRPCPTRTRSLLRARLPRSIALRRDRAARSASHTSTAARNSRSCVERPYLGLPCTRALSCAAHPFVPTSRILWPCPALWRGSLARHSDSTPRCVGLATALSLPPSSCAPAEGRAPLQSRRSHQRCQPGAQLLCVYTRMEHAEPDAEGAQRRVRGLARPVAVRQADARGRVLGATRGSRLRPLLVRRRARRAAWLTDTTPTSLDLTAIAFAKSSTELWKAVSASIVPGPEKLLDNETDFAAWLQLLSRRSSKKDLVFIFGGGGALAILPEELRSEFLSALRSQKTNRARQPTDSSEAPVKVRENCIAATRGALTE